MARCPYAIRFVTLNTRCRLKEGHIESGLEFHEATGLAQFASYQKFSWLPGDRREYLTDREDTCAWHEPAPDEEPAP